MTFLRPLLSSLVLTALVLVSLGMAMHRGAMAAEGQLCSVTGQAPVVFAHDGLPLLTAAGEPVTLDRETCLDCLVGALALGPADAGPTCAVALRRLQMTPARDALVAWTWLMGGLGRGPPMAA